MHAGWGSRRMLYLGTLVAIKALAGVLDVCGIHALDVCYIYAACTVRSFNTLAGVLVPTMYAAYVI